MGLFNDDDDKSLREKFDERVEGVGAKVTGDVEPLSDIDMTEVDTLGKPEPLPEIQQWEYKVLDLKEVARTKGLGEVFTETVGFRKAPPEELLNFLGKNGWELVESIEAIPPGSVESGGSKTDALIFRRPVEYKEEESDEGDGDKQ